MLVMEQKPMLTIVKWVGANGTKNVISKTLEASATLGLSTVTIY